MNKVFLSGRLAQDPELKTFSSGSLLCNIIVCTTDSYKGSNGEWKENSEWHRCVAWGKRGEAIAKHLKKGSPILVEGQLKTRSWEDKNGVKRYTTEIHTTNVEFTMNESSYQSKSGNASVQNANSSNGSEHQDSEFGDMPF